MSERKKMLPYNDSKAFFQLSLLLVSMIETLNGTRL